MTRNEASVGAATRGVVRRWTACLVLASTLAFPAAIARARTHLVAARSEAGLRALAAHPISGKIRGVFSHLDILVVDLTDPTPWANDPRVAFVEPERVHRPAARAPEVPPSPQRPDAWNIDAVNAPAAWGTTRGSGARVMVLDSGVDADHPALRDAFAKGKNFVGPAADFFDRDGHGTHVGHTIARVAPAAKLFAGRVCAGDACPGAALAGGLDWAIEEKVDVVNLSIAGDRLTKVEALALARAEAAGVIVTAASGNEGVGVVAYPAAVDSVLAVGAVDRDEHVARFSQWGPQLAVVAPGVGIHAALPRGTGRLAIVAIDGRRVPARAVMGSPPGDMTAPAVDARDPEVTQRVAVVTASISDVAMAARAAKDRGAVGVLVSDDDGRRLIGAVAEDLGVPVVAIENAAAEDLRARLALKAKTRVRVAVRASDYGYLGGSSTAVPHAAGVLALLRAIQPSLAPAAARAVVRQTARAIESNVNARSGRGLLDAGAAVSTLRANGPR